MHDFLPVCGSLWIHSWQSGGFSDWLHGVVVANGPLLSSFLPLRLHWLRMKPKHVLHSYVTCAINLIVGGNASNGVHSCFWDEWHWLSCLSGGWGSCYLTPSLHHYWPHVHFTGMWLSRNDLMCLDSCTSSFQGWWQHGVGEELFLFHLLLYL